MGLTLDSDCVVVVVSEEKRAVSLAEHGRLEADIPLAQFPAVLATCLRTSSPDPDAGSGGGEKSSSDEVRAA